MKKSDEAFFALCEYSLSQPESSARYLRTLADKLIYLAVRYMGWIGLVLAYMLLIGRASALSLSRVRHVAVLDIRAKLILRRDEINSQCQSFPIRRRHLPSSRILREMAAAHRRYLNLRRNNPANMSEGLPAEIPLRAATNEMYLFWLAHFYVHRSIILANAGLIKSTIRTVLTIEEFTPQIAGYLSALSDLQLPLILYLPAKLAEPKLTLQALPLFSKVIVKNGAAADFLRAHGRQDVLLEESAPCRQETAPDSPSVIAAVFLASFYTLTEVELNEFVFRSTIPYLRRFQELWKPATLRLFCHPNDSRARSILEGAGFEVEATEAQGVSRLANVDVVLSGNSSVIDEAIQAGVPVIYCGKLDSYSYDLMGYVKAGLVFDGTQTCPTQAVVEEHFRHPQTRATLHRYCRGSGSHRVVRLYDEINADISLRQQVI